MTVPEHHADVSGGWLRAATFGAMDGLVTNIALIAGVGGGGVSRHTLILTGVAAADMQELAAILTYQAEELTARGRPVDGRLGALFD